MKPDRIQMLDMAMNMLMQAKISHTSINKIVDNNDITLLGFGDKASYSEDATWGRHIYAIIRGCVGLLEINTADIQSLSKINFDRNESDEDE